MDAYSGKYYIQGGEEQAATILFLKDRLSIGLRDEHGDPRIVYWPYDQIIRDNFWKRGQSIARCGTYPVQTIEVNEKEFADKLEFTIKERERSWMGKFMNRNQWRMIRILAIFIVIVVSAYVWLVPFLAERLARRVPISYEEKLGDGIYAAIKPGFNIDAGKTAYINDFFRELNIDTKYNIRITVVNENIANAFAMPGGNIIVYDKIIANMNSYEELAALLSHEFTHVNEKHTTRSLFRQQASSLFISIIFGDVGTIGNVIVGSADNLEGLSYSRKLEKDADINGLKILSERKIDCNGFVHLFELLEKEIGQAGGESNEWISSHPDIERRIEYTKASDLFNREGVEVNETLKTLFMKIKTGD
ncbi:MAG TPA: M48 family metallopeptidase [Chitinophagaceae bacterium]